MFVRMPVHTRDSKSHRQLFAFLKDSHERLCRAKTFFFPIPIYFITDELELLKLKYGKVRYLFPIVYNTKSTKRLYFLHAQLRKA